MPNTRNLRHASLFALMLAMPGYALAQGAPGNPAAVTTPASPDTAVATVNGKPITQGDLVVAADDPALSLPGVDDAQKKGLLIDYMVDLKVGAQAAEAAKVGDTPDFKRKLAYFREKLLLDDYREGDLRPDR